MRIAANNSITPDGIEFILDKFTSNKDENNWVRHLKQYDASISGVRSDFILNVEFATFVATHAFNRKVFYNNENQLCTVDELNDEGNTIPSALYYIRSIPFFQIYKTNILKGIAQHYYNHAIRKFVGKKTPSELGVSIKITPSVIINPNILSGKTNIKTSYTNADNINIYDKWAMDLDCIKKYNAIQLSSCEVLSRNYSEFPIEIASRYSYAFTSIENPTTTTCTGMSNDEINAAREVSEIATSNIITSTIYNRIEDSTNKYFQLIMLYDSSIKPYAHYSIGLSNKMPFKGTDVQQSIKTLSSIAAYVGKSFDSKPIKIPHYYKNVSALIKIYGNGTYYKVSRYFFENIDLIKNAIRTRNMLKYVKKEMEDSVTISSIDDIYKIVTNRIFNPVTTLNNILKEDGFNTIKTLDDLRLALSRKVVSFFQENAPSIMSIPTNISSSIADYIILERLCDSECYKQYEINRDKTSSEPSFPIDEQGKRLVGLLLDRAIRSNNRPKPKRGRSSNKVELNMVEMVYIGSEFPNMDIFTKLAIRNADIDAAVNINIQGVSKSIPMMLHKAYTTLLTGYDIKITYESLKKNIVDLSQFFNLPNEEFIVKFKSYISQIKTHIYLKSSIHNFLHRHEDNCITRHNMNAILMCARETINTSNVQNIRDTSGWIEKIRLTSGKVNDCRIKYDRYAFPAILEMLEQDDYLRVYEFFIENYRDSINVFKRFRNGSFHDLVFPFASAVSGALRGRSDGILGGIRSMNPMHTRNRTPEMMERTNDILARIISPVYHLWKQLSPKNAFDNLESFTKIVSYICDSNFNEEVIDLLKKKKDIQQIKSVVEKIAMIENSEVITYVSILFNKNIQKEDVGLFASIITKNNMKANTHKYHKLFSDNIPKSTNLPVFEKIYDKYTAKVCGHTDMHGFFGADHVVCCASLGNNKHTQYQYDPHCRNLIIIDNTTNRCVLWSLLVLSYNKNEPFQKGKDEVEYQLSIALDNVEGRFKNDEQRKIVEGIILDFVKEYTETFKFRYAIIGTSYNDIGMDNYQSIPLTIDKVGNHLEYSDCFGRSNAYLMVDNSSLEIEKISNIQLNSENEMASNFWKDIKSYISNSTEFDEFISKLIKEDSGILKKYDDPEASALADMINTRRNTNRFGFMNAAENDFDAIIPTLNNAVAA